MELLISHISVTIFVSIRHSLPCLINSNCQSQGRCQQLHPLIDIEKSPWSSENKQSVKPSNADLAVEVKRRLEVLMFTDSSDKRFLQMKPNNKKREALIEWLVAYPINEALCVEFLKKESFRVAGVLERAIAEEKETSLAIKHGAWTGQIPYLRLIHCITDCDATRHAFLHRNDVMSREELDAQGSSDRPKTGFETIAHKWNDPSFNPTTRISSCHDDFSIAHNLSHAVAHITPLILLESKMDYLP